MKHGIKTALALGCGISLLNLAAVAQPQAPTQTTNTPAQKLSPKEQEERMSYAIGMDIGRNLQRGGVDLDVDVMAGAMKDMMAGKPGKLTDQQVQEAIMMYRTEARTKHEEQMQQGGGGEKPRGRRSLSGREQEKAGGHDQRGDPAGWQDRRAAIQGHHRRNRPDAQNE